jgi:4-hydroxybenzoate polyprenyltransferase
MAVMRLIRLPNLLIILFTLYSIRHLILGPVLASWGMSLNITHFDFSLLSFSIVLIAAGGYVINDYFDQKTDRINRPGEVIVGRSIPRRTAMAAHIILNTIGVLAGIYLSWKYGLFILGSMIFIFTSSALWFYSVDFKKRMLVGNLVIAILAGLIPLLPLVYETPLLGKNYRDVFLANHHSFSSLIKIIGVFSFFAFWFTLAREIVKDMEDFEGDLAAGGKTLPIRAGKKNKHLDSFYPESGRFYFAHHRTNCFV